jgi:hypothetical protein
MGTRPQPLLWIRDVLVRIQIRGSVQLTDPPDWIRLRILFFFHQWITRYQLATKKSLLQSFFAYYFLKVHLHQSSKIKCQKEVTK